MFEYGTVIPIVAMTKEEKKSRTQCYHCGKEKQSGKMFKCRGCRVAAYCCRAHQKADWNKLLSLKTLISRISQNRQ